MCKLPSVANIKQKERYHVYIGRRNTWLGLEESKWHNPFVLNKDEARGTTLDRYREYFLNSPKLIEALPELEGKILGCYCFSSKTGQGSPCHGLILVEMFEKFVVNKENE